MYTGPWMAPALDSLQVVYNNSHTALTLACYIATLLIKTITQLAIIISRNKEQQLKSYPWVHSSIGATSQVCFEVFSHLLHVYVCQEQTYMSTNVIDAYTCILLPGT